MTYTRTVKSHQTFYITQRKHFSHSDLISEVIIERLEPRLSKMLSVPPRSTTMASAASATLGAEDVPPIPPIRVPSHVCDVTANESCDAHAALSSPASSFFSSPEILLSKKLMSALLCHNWGLWAVRRNCRKITVDKLDVLQPVIL